MANPTEKMAAVNTQLVDGIDAIVTTVLPVNPRQALHLMSDFALISAGMLIGQALNAGAQKE